ncbi:MAG: EAL domain-containing protein [Acidaminococcaceae bacterium]|nr:EAL domain-containing protein [Acidaminococcaceae bacterium]
MQQGNETFNLIHKKHLVLVVDDEMINREILSQILADKYEVITATDGTKALAAIRDNRNELSLILLDLMMPGIHGLDLLKMIKGNKQMGQIPVIVMTSDQGSEVKSLQLGASDFVPKPYPAPAVILARIQRTIELSEDRKLIQSTERDTVTELYTREYFFRYAREFAKGNQDFPMDALLININHFHIINERYGKEYGNLILRRTAEKIRSVIKKTGGLTCRLEADTFLVYCRQGLDYNELLKDASVDLDKDDASNHVRLRIGVYQDVDKTIDIERCFDRAKMAANLGRNTYEQTISFYDTKLHESKMLSDRLLQDFENALEQRQFQVYYQPKFNVEETVPALSSAEALIRWKHPELGMISPGTFIPLFEENGLIRKLDQFVWREVAAQIRRWKDRFGYAVPISVNVSRVDMFDPNLVDNFKSLIDEYNISTSEYLLEITESAYTSDSAQIIEKVRRLRKLGFRIEMDDFGSGYSSLNMLSTLPIDALKLDMKFIRTAFSGRKDTRMIELIIDIADYLSVPVIAEGVETEEQMETLKKLGCQVIQGYYFSKPVPPEVFEKFITKKQAPVSKPKTAKEHVHTSLAEKKHLAEDADQKDRNVLYYHIAQALSSDFESIYYVNMETEEYEEFGARDSYGTLPVEQTGYNFFAECENNMRRLVYPEDLEKVLSIMKKDVIQDALRYNPVYTLDYRLMVNGRPEYYRLKIVRPESPDDSHIVIGIGNINSQIRHQMEQEKKLERAHHDKRTYARIAHALAKDFFIIYYVDIDTNAFIEFSSTDRYKELQVETNGVDFFESCVHNVPIAIHEEDVDKVLYVVNKENMLREIKQHGSVSTSYRMILSGESVYVNLKAIPMDDDETGSHHIVVAVSNIDAQMKREQEFAEAQAIAMKDTLTGVKNKRAYSTAERSINADLQNGKTEPFAIAVFDLYGTKRVNDTLGHEAGDRFIRGGCERICHTFRHSPVYRIGGDEFAAILRGRDYENRDALLKALNEPDEKDSQPNEIYIIFGMAEFDPENDKTLDTMFDRADVAMYENKLRLKKHRL